MLQHTKLYEFTVSMKLLLTGFTLTVCAAGLLAFAGLYHACKDADGDPAISFDDIRIFICGAESSPLERAAANPAAYGLADATSDDLARLRAWSRNKAPRSEFDAIRRILAGSTFDTGGEGLRKELDDNGARTDRYERIALLTRRYGLSTAELTGGIALYLALVGLVCLGLGTMFVRTSLFERTKTFLVTSTFILVAAAPAFLLLAAGNPVHVYFLLLAVFLLAVCIGVTALVVIYDLWFRRPAT
jgi:hypothetical protein